ncbi:MAG: hypothetical protein HC808_19490 [Candidatus Competibacteraceae bacterium]|nr:hypothetical protein [Candidatus Competibacteraceae bacterium]
MMLSGGVAGVSQNEDSPTIIASTDVVQTTLSRNALRAIFGMRLRNWPSGEPVQVFVLSDNHPLHIRFCKQMLNIFPHQLRFAWDRQVFSGTGQAPRIVDSVQEMHNKVATTPGAIGYLVRSRIDESVRVLPIE